MQIRNYFFLIVFCIAAKTLCSENPSTFPANSKVMIELSFISFLNGRVAHKVPRSCRSRVTSVSKGEDRPVQVAEVRNAARSALRSLLGKAVDQAVSNAAARAAATENFTALNSDILVPPQRIKIGFVGTGTITSAVITGLCSAEDACDLQITVSPRNQEKAAALRAKFPLQVTVAQSTQEVLDASDIVCIAVTPAQAQDVLSGLRYFAPSP
jgi:hypothetical protein